MLLEIIGLSIAGAAASAYIGRLIERRWPKSPAHKELRNLRVELQHLTTDRNYHKSRSDSYESQLEATKKQRDDYRKIAETHDVKMPTLSKPEVTKDVWDERHYGGHPRDNLVALEKDLEQFKDDEVSLTIKIVPKYGWVSKWADYHYDEETKWDGYKGVYVTEKKPKKSVTIERSGPPSRVMQELRTTLTDREFGLVTKELKTEPRAEASLMLPDLEVPFATWKDDDSPISFFVSLDVHRKAVQQPQVHTVEVLRVQEMVRDVVHEKVVHQTSEGAEVVRDVKDISDDPNVRATIEIAVEEALARRLGTSKPERMSADELLQVRRRAAQQQKQGG